jgi:hypothetical protein
MDIDNSEWIKVLGTNTGREYIKVLLDGVYKKLEEKDLSPEQRENLERTAAMYAGFLCSFWFPPGWVRRGIMIVFAIIGFLGLIFGIYFLILVWLLLPFGSPRISAEVLNALGKIGKVLNAKRR